MTRYPFPEELTRIPRDRSAVIEASAGTGKTFLIEHLVVDRLLHGDAQLQEILVVTFTDRAAAELLRRVRSLISRVLSHQERDGAPVPAHAWTLDAAARAYLQAAERTVDQAPISTIHAFCQTVLTEHAFKGGRLLSQMKVESRVAFGAELAELVRRRLAKDPALAPYLQVWLCVNGSVDKLEKILYQAWQLRCDLGVPFEPAELLRAAAAYRALPFDDIRGAVAAEIKNYPKRNAVLDRLTTLRADTAILKEEDDAPQFLAAIDQRIAKANKLGYFDYVERELANVQAPLLVEVKRQVGRLADATPPLDTAVAQRFVPVVAERLAARKRAAGLYDFDDMLSLVAQALSGPGGPALVETLRRRFRFAVIDEFQDTDPVQWEIFRTVFFDSAGRNPLYVVGDPKQAIYGFRGADVRTYTAASAEIQTAADKQHLVRNFRSRTEVVDAYNAILDQDADPPYFSAGTRYDEPVIPARDDRDDSDRWRADAAPVCLLRVTSDEDATKLPMRNVRSALAQTIAEEAAALLRQQDGPPAREIFVLTRTRRESEAIAKALGAVGVPHVLYNQEGLYQTPEARHVRDLLAAIEDPHDPAKRLRALLTPFFALSLGDLPSAAVDQGLADLLFSWHAAGSLDLARLYPRILAESGVVRRQLFGGESTRRLTNYLHLFDLLSAEAARAFRPLADVVRRLSALVAELVIPAPEEGNVLRLEGDRDAVQIMTMHKAKGLEADVVFVYGGFTPGPGGGVRLYTDGGRRVGLIGRPRRDAIAEMMTAERDADDERLYYVALTRARERIYLPYSGVAIEKESSPLEGPKAEELWLLNGGYRHVNRRLRALAQEERGRRLFASKDVPVALKVREAENPPGRAVAIAAWQPAMADLAALAQVEADDLERDPERVPRPPRGAAAAEPPSPYALLARLRVTRAGAAMTSYSRIKQAHGGYQPPTIVSDETADLDPDPAKDVSRQNELPGGARTGIFIHALLEELPLPSLIETPEFEAWVARPDVRPVIESALRRYGRDGRQLVPAARLAHAALTAPLPVVGGQLAGLARAARVAREMEFLFPFPEAAGGPDRGLVKGYMDLIFEHEGRSYFGDWKTDWLPAWDDDTVAAHVAANYALQEQLYALALVRMLGISDEASYDARFGGTLYVFVRGVAIRSRRPAYRDIQTWEASLGKTLEGEQTR